MKILTLVFLTGILIIFSAGFGSCGSQVTMPPTNKNMTENISDLEKSSGMKFPASAKVLSAADEGGHDGTKYERWIISSSEKFDLKGDAIEGDDSATFVKTLKEIAPETDFGQPKSDKYRFSDWQNEKGQWQAAAVETDKGFFLKLENIILD